MNISKSKKKEKGITGKISVTALSLALVGMSYVAYDSSAAAENAEAEASYHKALAEKVDQKLDVVEEEKVEAELIAEKAEEKLDSHKDKVKSLEDKVESFEKSNDKLKSELSEVKNKNRALQAKKDEVVVSKKEVPSSATATEKTETPKELAVSEPQAETNPEPKEEPEPEKEEIQEEKSVQTVSKETYKNWSSMTVSATGYTAFCNGCSGITATGIDLRSNPNQKVIAVDPSVIPLGSEVYVEGYGYAVAGDTGGAIKGGKIDLFMPSKSQALNWGRQNVTIYIK